MEPKVTIPKTSPNETPIWIKERVITKRKNTKLCALKLHWRLAKEGLIVLLYERLARSSNRRVSHAHTE